MTFAEGDILRFTANGMTLDGHQIRNGSRLQDRRLHRRRHPPGERLAGVEGFRAFQARHRDLATGRSRRPSSTPSSASRRTSFGAVNMEQNIRLDQPGAIQGVLLHRRQGGACGGRSSGRRSSWPPTTSSGSPSGDSRRGGGGASISNGAARRRKRQAHLARCRADAATWAARPSRRRNRRRRLPPAPERMRACGAGTMHASTKGIRPWTMTAKTR